MAWAIFFWPALWGVGVGAVVSAADSPPGSPGQPLRMLFVPSGDSQIILEGGQDLARLLQQACGLHFTTAVATGYSAVVEAMGAGKADIGWLATFSYVLAKQKHDVDLLLIVSRFGSPFYRGQIVVRADSGLRELADLKGKRAAFVDPASTSGHIYPKVLLRAQGYDPERFFSKSVFVGSHPAVILAVMRGEVDAGATYDDARAAVAKSYPDVFKQTRVIAYTKDIPNDVVAVRKGIDPAVKDKIRDGLRRVAGSPEGAKILKRIYGISGLADLDALFDPVRDAGRILNLDLEKLNR
jgi:phosphonate transport system substrate-binding protein